MYSIVCIYIYIYNTVRDKRAGYIRRNYSLFTLEKLSLPSFVFHLYAQIYLFRFYSYFLLSLSLKIAVRIRKAGIFHRSRLRYYILIFNSIFILLFFFLVLPVAAEDADEAVDDDVGLGR